MMTFSDMGGGVSPIADVSKKKRHFTAIPTNKTRKPHSLNLRNSKKMFLKTYNCNYSIYWIWIYILLIHKFLQSFARRGVHPDLTSSLKGGSAKSDKC